MARDDDEDTARLRFGATREGHKPEGQRQRDAEDRYWSPPQCACIVCGDVDDLPKGVEYDEFLCPACAEKRELDTDADYQNWLNHMREIAHEGT